MSDMRRFALVLSCFLTCSEVSAADAGGHAEYIGGTEPEIRMNANGALSALDNVFFVFSGHGVTVRVPYERINLIEYGQRVSNRIVEAILISPLFLMAKKWEHFLTIGFEDNEGRQQALVFKVDKNDIRTVLVSLEARTGQRVQYQDDEARRGGKG
jgi:hypothetical protein